MEKNKKEKAVAIAILALLAIAIVLFWLHDRMGAPLASLYNPTSRLDPLPDLVAPNVFLDGGAAYPPEVYSPTGATSPAQVFGDLRGPDGTDYTYHPYGLNPENNAVPGMCGCGFG